MVTPEKERLRQEHHRDGNSADDDQGPLNVKLAGEQVVDGLKREGFQKHIDQQVEQTRSVGRRRELVAPLEEDEEDEIAKDRLQK